MLGVKFILQQIVIRKLHDGRGKIEKGSREATPTVFQPW
jgi:hypothetical protein